MMDHVPSGWVSVELGDHVYIAGRIGWRGLKRSEYTSKGPLFLAVKNIMPDGTVDFAEADHISRERYDESPEIQLKPGDILLTKDGTIGKVAMVGPLPSATTVNSSILVVRPNNDLLLDRYLFHFLRGPQFQTIAHERITGSAIPHLFQKDIKKLSALVPPLAEQRRIVEKLEMLLAKVAACQKCLDTMPITLKRFRQSILAAACSGWLTADWREKNPDAQPYPVEVNHASEDDSENGHEPPASWRTTQLGALTTLVTSGSRGWAKYYSNSGSKFIRAQNINADVLDLSDIAFVKIPKLAEGSRTKVQQHDLLITITGANVTKVGLVEEPLGDAYVSQHVALVRPTDFRLSRFLFYSVMSVKHGRKQLLAAAYGQGKPGLNLENIREVVVELPPVAEQQEIVRRVDALFEIADQIEMRFNKSSTHIGALAQSILAKAFRGDLVATEANLAESEGRQFEPADQLLARVHHVHLTKARPQKSARRTGEKRATAS